MKYFLAILLLCCGLTVTATQFVPVNPPTRFVLTGNTAFITPGTNYLYDFQTNYLNYQFGAMLHFGLPTYFDQGYGETNPLSFWYLQSNSPSVINPSALNIDQWLDTIQMMGMNYVQFTASHSGGFRMWVSAYPYGLKETTWFTNNGINILASYASKTRARGLKVGVYYHVINPNWLTNNPGATIADNTTRITNELYEIYQQCHPDYFWFDGWGDYSTYTNPPYTTMTNFFAQSMPHVFFIDNNKEYTTNHSVIITYEVYQNGSPIGSSLAPVEWLNTSLVISNAPFYMWMWHSNNPVIASPATEAARFYNELQWANLHSGNYTLNFGIATNGLIDTTGLTMATNVAALTTNYMNLAPIVQYKLNGDFLDSSSNFNGTATNSPTFVTGQDGIANHAVRFSGGTNYFTSTAGNVMKTFGSNNWSMNFWFKMDVPSTSVNRQDIFDFADADGSQAFNFFVSTSSNLTLYINNASGFILSSGTNLLQTNVWYNVQYEQIYGSSFVFLNNNLEMFTNKVYGLNTHATNIICWGNNLDSSWNFRTNFAFRGVLDGVRIWPFSLTSRNIGIIYQQPSP